MVLDSHSCVCRELYPDALAELDRHFRVAAAQGFAMCHRFLGFSYEVGHIHGHPRSLMKNQNVKKTELELSGLDPEELEFMDIEERKKVLKAAGLDPQKYDF